MTTTKTLITLAAMAASLTALTIPAVSDARPMQRHPIERSHNDNRSDMRRTAELNNRINSVETRISLGRRSGQISVREAGRLNNSLYGITALKRSFERSGRGLNGSEVATLNSRLDTLSGQIRVQGHDGNRR